MLVLVTINGYWSLVAGYWLAGASAIKLNLEPYFLVHKYTRYYIEPMLSPSLGEHFSIIAVDCSAAETRVPPRALVGSRLFCVPASSVVKTRCFLSRKDAR